MKRKRLPPGIEYLSIVTVKKKKKKNPPYLNLPSVENQKKRTIHYSFDSFAQISSKIFKKGIDKPFSL